MTGAGPLIGLAAFTVLVLLALRGAADRAWTAGFSAGFNAQAVRPEREPVR